MMSFDALTTPPVFPADWLPGATVITTHVAGARHLSAAAFADATLQAYRSLRDTLQSAGDRHVVRIWNYIPALLADAGDGTNRYMAFNAGRFAAMCEWFGDDALAARAPAGTGVGNPGDDLVIHVLTTPTEGTAVQNPRQTPAMHYSARYGPRPPCFARATRVGRVLLVSGTAAITGEDTVAPNELSKQLDLTLSHLATLANGLGRYRALRAYVPHADDAAAVRDRLNADVPHAAVTVHVTDLCRPELRVEIEGVAIEGEPHE